MGCLKDNHNFIITRKNIKITIITGIIIESEKTLLIMMTTVILMASGTHGYSDTDGYNGTNGFCDTDDYNDTDGYSNTGT